MSWSTCFSKQHSIPREYVLKHNQRSLPALYGGPNSALTIVGDDSD